MAMKYTSFPGECSWHLIPYTSEFGPNLVGAMGGELFSIFPSCMGSQPAGYCGSPHLLPVLTLHFFLLNSLHFKSSHQKAVVQELQSAKKLNILFQFFQDHLFVVIDIYLLALINETILL